MFTPFRDVMESKSKVASETKTRPGCQPQVLASIMTRVFRSLLSLPSKRVACEWEASLALLKSRQRNTKE